MAVIEVPALRRTRVAGAVAKRMPIHVQLAVEPAEAGGVVAGIVEVRRGVLPFRLGDGEDLVLEREMRIPIGTWHAAYAVYVLAEQSVTIDVRVRWRFPVWAILLFVVAIAFGVVMAFLTTP